MDVVPRAGWGATAPLGPRMRLPAREAWLHHSVTQATGDPAADMRTLERIGVQRFGRFSYSYAVHPSGTVLEGAGLTIGAHTANRNSTSFGIVWIGNYDVLVPSAVQMANTAALIRHLIATGRLHPGVYPTGGHRDVAQTACPGEHAYARIGAVRALVDNPPQEDSMALIFEDEDEFIAAVRNAVLTADATTGTKTGSLADFLRKTRLAAESANSKAAQLLGREPAGDVDAAEVAAAVLAVLTPQAIAAVIPDDLASDVADKLAARLAE